MFIRVILPICFVLLTVFTLVVQKYAREQDAVRAAVAEQQRASSWMTQKQMEAHLRKRFHDAPVLVAIAQCESSFRHTLRDGSVLRGKVNSADVGVMQINLNAHGERLRKLNLNPLKLEDNVRYARILYGEKGTKPWRYSESCWGPKVARG